MKAKISILGFLDKKLFLSKKSLCFAFAIVIEICSVKFNVFEKFTPRSKTSKTLVKGSPVSSKTGSSGFISLFLLLINSHLDFSFQIFSYQVFAQCPAWYIFQWWFKIWPFFVVFVCTICFQIIRIKLYHRRRGRWFSYVVYVKINNTGPNTLPCGTPFVTAM